MSALFKFPTNSLPVPILGSWRERNASSDRAGAQPEDSPRPVSEPEDSSTVTYIGGRTGSRTKFAPADQGKFPEVAAVLSRVKKRTWHLSMHFPSGEAARLIAELDRILDQDMWEDDFPIPIEDSFKSLIRAIVFVRGFDWVALGISESGEFMSAFDFGSGLFTATFSPRDVVLWTYSIETEGQSETATGRTDVKGLEKIFTRYRSTNG
jgi:hypothetical protein